MGSVGRSWSGGKGWLEKFKVDVEDALDEFFDESFDHRIDLRLVLDPAARKYYITPDTTATEYYDELGVMSPRGVYELDSRYWSNMDSDMLEWEFERDPADAEFCIKRSDYERGKEDRYERIDDLWSFNDDISAEDRSEYLFFNIGDGLKVGVSWWDLFDGEQDKVEDDIDEWIEEIDEVLKRY